MRDPRQSPRVGDTLKNRTVYPANRTITAIDERGIEFSFSDGQYIRRMTPAQWREFARGNEIVKRAKD